MNDEVKAEILDEDKSRGYSDGLENLLANLGTSMDKRNASQFVNKKRLSIDGNQQELNALYRTDWLAGKVVDIIPKDMTREWRSFIGKIEPEVIQKLENEEDRLELTAKFNEAHTWARLYGTAFIVMVVDDGQTPDKPLLIEKIKEGGLKFLNVIDRHRLSNADVVPTSDPMDRNFGMPEFYRFNETSVKIHHSRVIRFDGVKLPYDEFRNNNYFSDSVLDRLYEALTNFSTVTDGSASMVYETNVDIMKVKGLMNYMQTAEGEDLLRKRFALAGMLKSFNNLMLLDSEEDWESKSNTFAGLPDLLDRYAQVLSAASDVPATRLLGTSASGLNATGEGDLKNYYDKIKSDQKKEYKPRLDYFDQIMGKSLAISEDADLSYKFNSLFQMTPKEQAEVEFINAQRDALYLDRDVITEEIVRKELVEEGTYTNIDEEFIKELEEMENDFGNDIDSGDDEFANGEETEVSRSKNTLVADPSSSLNGAQVTAILEIINKVRTGFMKKSTAEKVMMTSFPITPEEAANILSEVPVNVDGGDNGNDGDSDDNPINGEKEEDKKEKGKGSENSEEP